MTNVRELRMKLLEFETENLKKEISENEKMLEIISKGKIYENTVIYNNYLKSQLKNKEKAMKVLKARN